MPDTIDRTTLRRLNGLVNEEPTREGTDADYYVLGGEHLGRAIARKLQAAGHAVYAIDETHDPNDLPGRRGNPRDVRLLNDAGVCEASTVVVATPRDSRNLLIAQLVRTHFDVSEVVVVVNRPGRRELVGDVGHEPVCATTVLAEEVVAGLDAVTAASEAPS